MNSFAVVTDSAADIPLDLAERFGIHVVPLHVVFDGIDYSDGVDLDTAQLLDLMKGSDTLPVTSQPTPADFLAVYKEVVEEGYTQILSIHLSRALDLRQNGRKAAAEHVGIFLRRRRLLPSAADGAEDHRRHDDGEEQDNGDLENLPAFQARPDFGYDGFTHR